MTVIEIKDILTEAGFTVLGEAGGNIILEDPTCIMRNLLSFIDFAWAVLLGLTAITFFGWGISLIRGAAVNITENFKNLFLLIGGLTVVPALLNLLLGQGALKCDQVRVRIPGVSKYIILNYNDGSREWVLENHFDKNDKKWECKLVVDAVECFEKEIEATEQDVAYDLEDECPPNDPGCIEKTLVSSKIENAPDKVPNSAENDCHNRGQDWSWDGTSCNSKIDEEAKKLCGKNYQSIVCERSFYNDVSGLKLDDTTSCTELVKGCISVADFNTANRNNKSFAPLRQSRSHSVREDIKGSAGAVAERAVGFENVAKGKTKAGRTKYDVVYSLPDGSRVTHSGGEISWRNNNPGNIKLSKTTKSFGAIGESGGFAVFPDYKTGYEAIKKLFKASFYIDLSLSAALEQYSPAFDNEAGVKEKRIKMIGLPANKKLRTFTPEQMERLANVIQITEGWGVGKVTLTGGPGRA